MALGDVSDEPVEGLNSSKPVAPRVAKIVVGLNRLGSWVNASVPDGRIDQAADPVGKGKRPFAIWVISIGLVFAGLDLLFGISRDLLNPSAFDIIFIPLVGGFVLLCFVGALGSLKQKRWGYLLSAVVSLAFALPSLAFLLPTASNPSDFATFAVAVSSVPILILVAAFSLLCLRNAKRLPSKKYLSSGRSLGGAFTLAVVVIVIGAMLAGASQVLAAGTQNQAPSAVSIVVGASNPQNAGHYGPSTITVVIGVNNTIAWTNHDFSVHTVTGDSGNFDSGLLNMGDSWTHTFTTPGTYNYHCNIHPYMVGTVVVKGR